MHCLMLYPITSKMVSMKEDPKNGDQNEECFARQKSINNIANLMYIPYSLLVAVYPFEHSSFLLLSMVWVYLVKNRDSHVFCGIKDTRAC